MSTNYSTPSVDELAALFVYDPDTGVLRRKTARGSAKVGDAAGGGNSHGYLVVFVGKRRAMVHRVCWALHYGRWPQHQIDHINRNRMDNRIANLREATSMQNAGNTNLSCRNTSGIRGVSWSKGDRAWVAYIRANGKQRRLGVFADKAEAAAVYAKAARLKFGEFYA